MSNRQRFALALALFGIGIEIESFRPYLVSFEWLGLFCVGVGVILLVD